MHSYFVPIVSVVFLILIVLLLCLYLCYENNFLEISHYDVHNTKVCEEIEGFKIVQISDFHNTMSVKLHCDLINAIKAESPNIVVFTGDLVDARKPKIGVALDFVSKVKEIAPVFFIKGNHERGLFEQYEKLEKGLNELGVTILDNKEVMFMHNGVGISILGLNDIETSGSNREVADYFVNLRLDDIDYSGDSFTLLLAHRPEVQEFVCNREVPIDLILSGHYHGGQVRLPFIGGVFSPDRVFFPNYTQGVRVMNRTTNVLSRGIGNSLLPFRINNRPELVVITLHS